MNGLRTSIGLAHRVGNLSAHAHPHLVWFAEVSSSVSWVPAAKLQFGTYMRLSRGSWSACTCNLNAACVTLVTQSSGSLFCCSACFHAGVMWRAYAACQRRRCCLLVPDRQSQHACGVRVAF